jgi:uncharacterized protein
MRLDECQGYLCAALAGPQPIPAGQWLERSPRLTPEESGSALPGARRPRCCACWHSPPRRSNWRAAKRTLLLLLYAEDDDDEDAASDYVPWCEGYLHGSRCRATEDWFEFAWCADDDEEDTSDEVDLPRRAAVSALRADRRRRSGRPPRPAKSGLSGEEFDAHSCRV